jgi:hypothetical protein
MGSNGKVFLLCTWLQHVQRMDTNRLPKQALQYKPKGRNRGWIQTDYQNKHYNINQKDETEDGYRQTTKTSTTI